MTNGPSHWGSVPHCVSIVKIDGHWNKASEQVQCIPVGPLSAALCGVENISHLLSSLLLSRINAKFS